MIPIPSQPHVWLLQTPALSGGSWRIAPGHRVERPLRSIAYAQRVMFWGLGPEAWTAIATFGSAVLVGVGAWQVSELQSQNKKSRTLTTCEKYDLDLILDASLRNLAAGNLFGDFAKAPRRYKTDVTTILNYLDSVAIGIEQGLYIDALAKHHLSVIVKNHVNDYLYGTGAARSIGVDPKNFGILRALAER